MHDRDGEYSSYLQGCQCLASLEALSRIIGGVRPDVAVMTIYDPQKGRKPTDALTTLQILVLLGL